jgi:Outer membrane protein beta-barrel domain
MKKLLLSLFALAATIGSASAQVEIGLKVSPGITFLGVDSPSDNALKSEGSRLGFGGGLVVDYFFGENYAIGTGLQFMSKGGSYSYVYRDGNNNAQPAGTTKLAIHYLELPLTVKLFTNEISSGTRLYFQTGFSLATPIGARINGEKRYVDPVTKQETTALQHVTFLDANFLASVGAEYTLGQSTKTFVGISYHRGLINTDSYFDDERSPKLKDFILKNNVFALDLGLKF